jgi:hypothetical protein
MMLNAQKTISPSFKTAVFKRYFGQFLADRSRLIRASKRGREKRTPRSDRKYVYLKLCAGYVSDHLLKIKKVAAGETEN